MMLFRIRNIWYNIRKVKQGGHIMAADNEITRELNEVQGGRITFAPDVIATIASLAAAEVEGVEGMAGGVVEGITGMLNNKKSMTKGVKVEVNEEGKGKVTFTNDALKNATTWDDTFTKQISVDWTKYSEIEFDFDFELDGQYKYKFMYVESSVKAPEITVTPTTPVQPFTPAKPAKPAKPAENKGTTTTTTTTTTTKKEVPKTGDTMNVALYASLLLVSALAAVVLTTKKRITE